MFGGREKVSPGPAVALDGPVHCVSEKNSQNCFVITLSNYY